MANRALMTPIDQPSASSAVGCLQRPRHDRAEPDEQHVAALAEHLAATDRDGRRRDRLEPEPGVARVVERERVVLGERRAEERAQLLLVPGRGDHEVRQLALGRAA